MRKTHAVLNQNHDQVRLAQHHSSAVVYPHTHRTQNDQVKWRAKIRNSLRGHRGLPPPPGMLSSMSPHPLLPVSSYLMPLRHMMAARISGFSPVSYIAANTASAVNTFTHTLELTSCQQINYTLTAGCHHCEAQSKLGILASRLSSGSLSQSFSHACSYLPDSLPSSIYLTSRHVSIF